MIAHFVILVWAVALFLFAGAATIVVAGVLDRFEANYRPEKTHKKIRKHDMAA